MSSGSRPHVAFVVNVDWFFLSHRLPLARAARDAGCNVTVIAADTGSADAVRREGFRFLPMPLSRAGANPLAEVRSLAFLLSCYRRERPDLVHQVTIKPVLYGSIAARLVGGIRVVNAISGFGYLLTGTRNPLRQRIVRRMYRTALRGAHAVTIFQNADDRSEFVDAGIVAASRTRLIRGSGVDCDRFVPTPEPEGDCVVMLPSRMLRDKGVETFVAAAQLLSTRGVRARFVLVGGPDAGNPASIPAARLAAWTAAGTVEWWGHAEDMTDALRQAHIVVLPTRREGLPKVLLEAAATARPIVATDVPGCREVVRHEVTGLLVPPDDVVRLADAIERLVGDAALRRAFGAAGRALVENELSETIVVQRTMDLYRELLGDRWPDGTTLSAPR